MHAVVVDNLEEYLAGALKPAVQREVESHLSLCESCRQEVAAMQDLSLCFHAFHAPEPVQPSAGFYAQVRRQIGDRHSVPAFAGLFALDFAFGRRLVFASLITLAILGSYLVTTETEYPTGLSPAAVMAQQDSPAFDSAPARDNMLVSMTYEP
jgi:anti-sigma factor RsiW